MDVKQVGNMVILAYSRPPTPRGGQPWGAGGTWTGWGCMAGVGQQLLPPASPVHPPRQPCCLPPVRRHQAFQKGFPGRKVKHTHLCVLCFSTVTSACTAKISGTLTNIVSNKKVKLGNGENSLLVKGYFFPSLYDKMSDEV